MITRVFADITPVQDKSLEFELTLSSKYGNICKLPLKAIKKSSAQTYLNKMYTEEPIEYGMLDPNSYSIEETIFIVNRDGNPNNDIKKAIEEHRNLHNLTAIDKCPYSFGSVDVLVAYSGNSQFFRFPDSQKI